MNQHHIDPKTGFITSENRNSFTAEMKVKFLAMCQEYVDKQEYPNLNYICKMLGIHVNTFYKHKDTDDAFGEGFDEIETQIENILNRSLISNGQKANGVGASAFWLKNRKPKRWSDNPAGNQPVIDFGALKKLLDSSKSLAIDAEIVPPPQINGPNGPENDQDASKPK